MTTIRFAWYLTFIAMLSPLPVLAGAGDATPSLQTQGTGQLDPDMQTLLDALASLQGKPLSKLTPAEARVQPTLTDAMIKVLKDEGRSTAPLPVGNITHLHVQGPAGDMVFNIYAPRGRGPFPVIVFYHGGGFVTSDTEVYDASIRGLVNGAQAVVVAPDYHLAPEYKFPSQPNEGLAAYLWVRDNATRINGDPRKVALAGESAGANLAAVVALMARDRQVPMPIHQLLIYPITDNNPLSDSYVRYANAKPLSADMLAWYFKHYLNSKADAASPYAYPNNATTLKGLPSTTLITAEIDPLMSEGKAYAERLQKDGVPVAYHHYEGVTHKFFGMAAVLSKAKEAQQFASDELKKAFSNNNNQSPNK